MKTINFEIATNGLTERRGHDGIEYLIVPVIPIKEGVLNGELVLNEEIARFIEAWNGIPLPVYHPQENGLPVSAQTPDIVANSLGKLWYSSFEGGVLRGELWIDVKRATSLGYENLVAHLEAGNPVEVSTGYYRDVEYTSGIHEGVSYESIARNIRPDHLALLPNAKGACSWEMGCGAPRVNQDYADHAMIALYLEPEDAERLAMDHPNALPANNLHLTLAYLGKVSEQPMDQGMLLEILADVARWEVVIQGSVNGLVRFRGEQRDAYCWTFDSPQLKQFIGFIEWVKRAGYVVSEKHLFKPHITRAYLDADEPTPPERPELISLTLKRLGLSWGDKTIFFELQGEILKMNDEQRQVINDLITNAVSEAIKPLQERLDEVSSVYERASEIVANQEAREQAEREQVVTALVANGRFTKEELDGQPTSFLIKMLPADRIANYSGRPMPRGNSSAVEINSYQMPAVLAAEGE